MASTRARRLDEHYKPIEDYGVIGDLETVALVGKDASIDFMCFPQFDSPTIFAALLDYKKGGRFQLCPVINDAVQRQLYLPDSNILLTRFLSEAGVAEVSDFMPITQLSDLQDLVRRAKTGSGHNPVPDGVRPAVRLRSSRTSCPKQKKRGGFHQRWAGQNRVTTP